MLQSLTIRIDPYFVYFQSQPILLIVFVFKKLDPISSATFSCQAATPCTRASPIDWNERWQPSHPRDTRRRSLLNHAEPTRSGSAAPSWLHCLHSGSAASPRRSMKSRGQVSFSANVCLSNSSVSQRIILIEFLQRFLNFFLKTVLYLLFFTTHKLLVVKSQIISSICLNLTCDRF